MNESKVSSLWVEEYRPKTIQDCVLPDRLKAQFQEMVDDGEITSLLLCGTAGSGKTTVAKALCIELECDFMLINASEESGIDVVRSRVKSFASTQSLMSQAKHKVVIFDEADYLGINAQASLRGLIEEFSKNCRFIFTCNFKNRIIDPIHSRCSVIDFNFDKADRESMMATFFARTCDILKSNDVPFDKKVVAQFIMAKFPDFRSVLNELQRYSKSGEIDVGLLRLTGDAMIAEVLKFLKEKRFGDMRKWVDMNDSLDTPSLFNKMYDKFMDELEPAAIPDFILILDEYQDKATRVINQRINMAACLTQLMANLHWRK